MALIVANSRDPQERLGDIEAQLASHRMGESRLSELMIDHDVETTIEHANALLDYSRKMTEAVINEIPDGTYRFRDAMEGDGQNEYEIPINVALTVQGREMTVDFAGSAPQVAGNVNAVTAIVESATWYCVRLLANEDVPVNHGCFQPVKVITPPGSVLNPRFPAAVVVGNTETSQRVVDTVLGALAQALPDVIPAASQGTMNNFAVGGFNDGAQFVLLRDNWRRSRWIKRRRRPIRAAVSHDQHAEYAPSRRLSTACRCAFDVVNFAKAAVGWVIIMAGTASYASTSSWRRRGSLSVPNGDCDRRTAAWVARRDNAVSILLCARASRRLSAANIPRSWTLATGSSSRRPAEVAGESPTCSDRPKTKSPVFY